MSRICKKCGKEKSLQEFVKYSKGYRGYCKECHISLYPRKTKLVYEYINLTGMIKLDEGVCYYMDSEGSIFKKMKCGVKTIEKRLGSRGFCELKIAGKTYTWHLLVAKYLIPNPNNCNMVFFNSSDRLDVRPQNLRWVWTRYKQKFTPKQALEKTDDKILIQYYNSMDRSIIDKALSDKLNYMIIRYNPEYVRMVMSNLYLTIIDYADRCLLFDFDKDVRRTYFALLTQERRNRINYTQINEKYI